jgi:hypothetical protein
MVGGEKILNLFFKLIGGDGIICFLALELHFVFLEVVFGNGLSFCDV